MNRIITSLIFLLSEGIWIYFVIAMFASVEWNESVFVLPTWWVVAALSGLFINLIIVRFIHYVLLLIVNGILLSFILFQNWQLTVYDGKWIFGIILSIAIIFIFVRSASFVYIETTRQQMLRRFEGNIIFYALLSLVFSQNNWGNEWFHITFLAAIFMSLLGMILFLQHHEKNENTREIEIQKIGSSRWFTAFITSLLIGITFLSTILFLPSIRSALKVLGENGWELLKWIFAKISAFILWLLGLLPVPNEEATLPEMAPNDPSMSDEIPEEIIYSFPIEWVIAIGGLVFLVIAVWVLAKFLKTWRPPKIMKSKKDIMIKNAWWSHLKKTIKSFWFNLNKKWRLRFSKYYKHQVFWYFYQVQMWGSKNGIVRLKSETAKEYIEKVILSLSELGKKEELDILDELTQSLRRLTIDYQAAYYGSMSKIQHEKYRDLLQQLNQLSIKRNLTERKI